MVSLESPLGGEIKRHPEVETFLMPRNNRTEVAEKVLSWPTEGWTEATAPCR